MPSIDYLIQHAYLWIAAGFIVYGIFFWLDRKASPEAKSAIAEWLETGSIFHPLEPTPENMRAVARAIRELFDHIYTQPIGRDSTHAQEPGDSYRTPLVTWRAFWRSALFTLVATYILTYVIFRSRAGDVSYTSLSGLSNTFLSGILVNITADYIALYVIRMWLVTDGVSAREALFIAPLAGILLVISFTGLRLVSFTAFNLHVGQCFPFDAVPSVAAPGDAVAREAALQAGEAVTQLCTTISTDRAGVTYLAQWDRVSVQHMLPIVFSLHLPGVLAACIVHLWLPVFALCVGILRSLYFILRWVKVAHWLLGNHPLEAIGIVAALLTAITVLLLQGLAYALS